MKRGPKPALSIERIVQTAIEIADAEGLAAVSMQRVATEFGFTTMSLYRYVPSKTALVALMLDTAPGEPPLLDEGDWRAKIELWVRLCHSAYQRHLWMLEAAPARRRMMGRNELAWFEAALKVLAGTGLSAAEQHDAFIVLIGLVRTAAQQEADAASAAEDEEWGQAMAQLLNEEGDNYPALRAAIQQGAFDPSETDSLEFGLRCVLDGLERRAESRALGVDAIAG